MKIFFIIIVKAILISLVIGALLGLIYYYYPKAINSYYPNHENWFEKSIEWGWHNFIAWVALLVPSYIVVKYLNKPGMIAIGTASVCGLVFYISQWYVYSAKFSSSFFFLPINNDGILLNAYIYTLLFILVFSTIAFAHYHLKYKKNQMISNI